MDKYVIELVLRRPYGEKSSVVCFPADEAFAEYDLKLNCPPVSPLDPNAFETTIQRMKYRVIRKDKLADLCVRMGRLMAERIEDEEGWHGDDRQKRCLEARE